MTAVLPISVDPGSTAILARLLSDAFEALDDDIDLVRVSLSRAVALLNGAPGAAGTAAGGLAAWQARRIRELVEDNLERGLRTPELAASARLSTSHFSRAFKSDFGQSPQQYILERRVALAQRLMLVSDSRLCEIALACGFSDQAHMSRMFRRVVGAPPNAWRRGALPSPGLS